MYAHPDQYALPGDTVTSRINRMLELAPLGTHCEIPGKGYGVLQRTVDPVLGPQPYYLKRRRSVSIVNGVNHRRPIQFDSSGAGVADLLLIEPDEPDFVDLQTEIAFKANPVGGAIGDVQLMEYDPSNELCNYVRDVIRINCRAGYGATKLHVHDCYLPFGTGWALNVIGLSGHAGVNSSTFERIWTSGGMRFDHLGDAVAVRDCKLDGKAGFEYRIMDGAGEILFEQMQITPSYGPAIYGRGGNKVTMRQVYIEQKGWNRPGQPKAIMDLRHNEMTGAAKMNALTLDGVSVLNQSGVTMDQLILVGNAISPIFRRINYYAVNDCVNAIKVESNSLYPRFDGPFTYYGNFTGGKIDCNYTPRPYGHAVRPLYWNGIFDIADNNATDNLTIIKSRDGIVTIAGVVKSSTPPTNGYVAFGLPDGFRAYKEVAIPIMSDTGPCFMVCSPQTDDTNGTAVSLEGVPANATRFRLSGSFPEFRHMNGIETPN